MNSTIIGELRKELEAMADPVKRVENRRYFKGAVQSYGVKNGEVNRLAALYYRQVKTMPKREILELCEELLISDYNEEAFIAFDWSSRLEKSCEREDFDIFERWLDRYVNNWAKCDTLCNHTIGSLVMKYTEFLERLRNWTSSGNRWVRRGAAVSLIIPAKGGLFLQDIFDIAERLLLDTDDLVQKGYGWMLKEAARLHRKEVFAWVLQHKAVMPRTALRYAIEKMPPDMRRAAMDRH